MKKSIFALVLIAGIMFSVTALAGGEPYGPKSRRFGAGIIAGEPTGLTLKGYLSQYLALDSILSWSFVDDAFTVIGDVTYDFLDIPFTNKKTVTFPFYAGAGAKIGIHSKRNNEHKTIVGVRVPVGIGVQWQRYPVEVHFEVAPGIELAPDTEFDISGGIGVRYYFF